MKNQINPQEMFINARYLGTSARKFSLYYLNNGVLKLFLPKTTVKEESHLWCKVSDLDVDTRKTLIRFYQQTKGTFKRYLPSKKKQKLDQTELWCKLEDLPESTREELTNVYYSNENTKTIKRYIPSSKFWKSAMDENKLWCRLSDLPKEVQVDLSHMANTLEEVTNTKEPRIGVVDSNQVKVFIDDETLILPVVGNLLASDGTYAYTVEMKNDKPTLEPIVICWNCHWSDLFAGNTKYDKNVFCLYSELSDEQREYFADAAILLKDAPDFLGITKSKKLEMKKKKRD